MASHKPPEQYNLSTSRPLIVTIVGFLEIIAGFIGLIAAGVIFLGYWFGGFFAGGFSGGVAGFFTGLLFGGFALVIALVTLAVGFGLLRGSGWAWTFAVIISAINVIIGLAQIAGAEISTLHFGVVGWGGFTGFGTLIIAAVSLFYLYRPNVKAFFNKF